MPPTDAAKVDFQWDLSSGSAQSSDVLLEIPVVAGPTWGVEIDETAFPYVYRDGETAEFVLDVWNCDRRMALVWTHYLKPATWWDQFGGLVAPSRPAPSQEITAIASTLVRAGQSILEIGPYPSATWQNGANAAKDGLELVTGVTGIRLRFAVTFHGLSAWDIVGQLSLKPDQVFGCDGIGQKVASRYVAQIPPQAAPVDFHV